MTNQNWTYGVVSAKKIAAADDECLDRLQIDEPRTLE